MTRQPPPELFAQRPVRSDFGRASYGVVNPRRLAVLVGLIVLAGVAGVAINMAGHDPSAPGEIPTIHAEMPIKQKPDQPGGIDIPHQDVTVFQKLDTKGDAPTRAGVEHLLPGPETPQPVPAASVAGEVQTAPAPAPSAVAPVETSEALPPAISEAAPPPPPAVKEEPVKPVAPQVAAKAAEPAKEASKKVETPKPAKAVEAKPVEKTVETKPAASASTPARLPKELFTAGNPATVADTAAVAGAPSVAATTTTEAVASTSSGKKAQVQLASYPDEPSAQRELPKMQSKYAGALGGAKLRVVRATIAKGTFYRIMSEPLSEQQAKSICATLTSQRASCLVAR